MNRAPIGFFDSGVGGLTIWKEVVALLPYENTIYLADSINAPYGDKSPDEILRLSKKNTEKLLELGSKLIVVACNTATTNAIVQLRTEYNVPFVGIEPAIKPAALQSNSKRIGVLATRGTLSSSLFASRSRDFADGIQIIEQEGVGLVSLIESGVLDGDKMRLSLKRLLDPMLEKEIDHLVLGCTHYPFLILALQAVLPKSVKILDCGVPVARQVRNVLNNQNLLCENQTKGHHQLFTNTNPDVMNHLIDTMGFQVEGKKLDF
jgi:glutamate racemase